MKINNKEYGFNISPNYGKVIAEIYEVYEWRKDESTHIRLISKEFGSMFRTPNESDYKKAREWVDLQMNGILTSNTIL